MRIGARDENMTLDVDVPEPPQLTNRGIPRDYASVEAVSGPDELRRDEIDAFLRDGAWNEAFEEWADYTDLTPEEFDVALEVGLVQRIDIFWDPTEARLRSDVPPIPDGWHEQADVAPSDARELAAMLEAELADLGRTVVEMLQDAYVDWTDPEPADPVWDEETFGHGSRE